MKNWKKLTAAALAALALVGALSGCGNNADKNVNTKQATKIVTDLKGREVSVPQNVQRIAVVPIPWASVIYAIDGSSERLAAIHPAAMSAYKGKFLENRDKHFAQLDTKMQKLTNITIQLIKKLLRKKPGKRPISQLFCSCVMPNCACRVMITSCMRLFVLAVERIRMDK